MVQAQDARLFPGSIDPQLHIIATPLTEAGPTRPRLFCSPRRDLDPTRHLQRGRDQLI